jgi:hypothetical protein
VAVHSLHPKVFTKTAKLPRGQHPPRLPRASLARFFSARTTTTRAQLQTPSDGSRHGRIVSRNTMGLTDVCMGFEPERSKAEQPVPESVGPMLSVGMFRLCS